MVRKKIRRKVTGFPEFESEFVDVPETFWVMTRPTEQSGLADVVFEADYHDLVVQGWGRLPPEDIIGVYGSEKQAVAAACKVAEEKGHERLKKSCQRMLELRRRRGIMLEPPEEMA